MSLTYGTRRIQLRGRSAGFIGPLALALLLAVLTTASRGNDRWLTSYDAALAAAEESGRPVLAVFTGSDWCQHCRTLERNVLETEDFIEWASDRVVLLMIDLPKDGITLDERKARSRICMKYGVRSFPNTVLIAPNGAAIATQAGYRGQDTGAWLASFDRHAPIRVAAISPRQTEVHSSMISAVETARGSRKPILVMVSRPGDASATTRLTSLMKDPEFESLAREHFVVAQLPPAGAMDPSPDDDAVAELIGEEGLPPDAFELVVTDDGHTPLFKESGTQEARGVVSGLRRFLAARQGASARR
jgi:protein disulfide-isomerase